MLLKSQLEMWVDTNPLPAFLFKKLPPVSEAVANEETCSNVCPIVNDRKIPLPGPPLLTHNTKLQTEHFMPHCKLIRKHS
jgi:hypothetical protein